MYCSGRDEIYKELDMDRHMKKQDTEGGSGQFDKIYLLLTMLPWAGPQKTEDGEVPWISSAIKIGLHISSVDSKIFIMC